MQPITHTFKYFLSAVSDIDECATRVCDQGCENNEGSYRCFCYQGYRYISDNECLGELSFCRAESSESTEQNPRKRT